MMMQTLHCDPILLLDSTQAEPKDGDLLCDTLPQLFCSALALLFISLILAHYRFVLIVLLMYQTFGIINTW